MNKIAQDRLIDIMDATWAPEAVSQHGPFVLRKGGGGGKRVSAATTAAKSTHVPSPGDISEAAEQMSAMGQAPLFMIGPDEAELDHTLANLGYDHIDPVCCYAMDLEQTEFEMPPPVSAIDTQEPLAIMAEIWADNGIDANRIQVMERTVGPKTFILGRNADKACGAGFAAVSDNVAMLHALAVAPAFRRHGVARNIVYKTIAWAKSVGAGALLALTTENNNSARNLFESLGMTIISKYHYRTKDTL